MVGEPHPPSSASDAAAKARRRDFDRVFSVSKAIRYVAFAQGQTVEARSRPDLASPSDGQSDFFEELFVNPGLIVLARQRGELDCGGLAYVIVGYGHFSQIVMPLGAHQHLSVCVELNEDAAAVARELIAMSASLT